MADAKQDNQQPAESKSGVVITNYKNEKIELDSSVVIDFAMY